MTRRSWRGASAATIVAVLAIAVTVTGCGRLADRLGDESAPGPAASTELPEDSSTLDEVEALLDEVERTVRDAEQDAAEGDAAVRTSDEP